MPRYLAQVEYQGTAYRGWQIQPNESTIQGTIEAALARIFQTQIPIAAPSRTDAGVHALAQYFIFDSPQEFEPWLLRKSLNGLLPKDISIIRTTKVAPDFELRSRVKSKSYSYQIQQAPYRPAFNREFSWWIIAPLQLELIQEAMALLIGEHDFSAFRGQGCGSKNPVKRLYTANLTLEPIVEGNKVNFNFQGSGFVKHQIRLMVGGLVQLSRGKSNLAEFTAAIEEAKGLQFPLNAPAQGLTLEEIQLEPNPFEV